MLRHPRCDFSCLAVTQVLRRQSLVISPFQSVYRREGSIFTSDLHRFTPLTCVLFSDGVFFFYPTRLPQLRIPSLHSYPTSLGSSCVEVLCDSHLGIFSNNTLLSSRYSIRYFGFVCVTSSHHSFLVLGESSILGFCTTSLVCLHLASQRPSTGLINPFLTFWCVRGSSLPVYFLPYDAFRLPFHRHDGMLVTLSFAPLLGRAHTHITLNFPAFPVARSTTNAHWKAGKVCAANLTFALSPVHPMPHVLTILMTTSLSPNCHVPLGFVRNLILCSTMTTYGWRP